MRLALIYKAVSTFVFVLSLSLAVPLIYSILTHDGEFKAFLIPLLVALMLFLPSLGIKFQDLNLKEAITSVVLTWFLFPAIAALVYLISGYLPDPVNAYFESVSGFTTTGATVLNNIEALPKSVLLWRSLTQWLGGLGFIVFSFSLLPFLRVSYHLIRFESSKLVEERISPNIFEVVRIVLGFYLAFTVLGALFLRLAGMDWYNAFNHIFTALSTGGFSTKNSSVAAFNSFPVELVLELFMLLGSINLTIYYRAFKERNPFKVFTYFETRSLLILTLLGVLFITFDLWRNHFYPNLWEDLRYALFQGVSAVTTTGFANDDFNKYPPFAVAVMFFLTLIGGSAGSTAGGLKQLRFVVLLKILHGEIRKTLHPRLVFRYSIGGKVLDINVLYGILAFGFIYMVTVSIFGILLTVGGHDLITSFSASIACLTSFGPGLGKVGPMDNFDVFTDWQKLLLSLEMVLGRLEILPVLAFVYALLFER